MLPPVVVGGAGPADAPELAALHRRCFPDYASSRLGERFCRTLFAAYLARDGVAVLGARTASGVLVGYVVATPPSGQRAVNDAVTRQAALAGVARALRSPSELVGLARRARSALRSKLGRSSSPAGAAIGSDEVPETLDPGEAEVFRIVLICVDASARGQGVADALLAAFAVEGRRRGHAVGDLVVAAENEHAQRCYERNGWTRIPDDGGASRRYRVELAGPG